MRDWEGKKNKDGGLREKRTGPTLPLPLLPAEPRLIQMRAAKPHGSPGLTISFSGEIPVIGGNGIPFRNSGEFRRISVNFGRIFLNFEFSKRNFPKIPKYFFPVPSGNGKFRRNFKPCGSPRIEWPLERRPAAFAQASGCCGGWVYHARTQLRVDHVRYRLG